MKENTREDRSGYTSFIVLVSRRTFLSGFNAQLTYLKIAPFREAL